MAIAVIRVPGRSIGGHGVRAVKMEQGEGSHGQFGQTPLPILVVPDDSGGGRSGHGHHSVDGDDHKPLYVGHCRMNAALHAINLIAKSLSHA